MKKILILIFFLMISIYPVKALDVIAKSGSAEDIQAAVDKVAAAGGGNVFIPEGNFTFKINYTLIRINNRYAGVQIPGGVNIFGAGTNKTILYTPISAWNISLSSSMFVVDGSNDKPVRISGITFQGSVNLSWSASDDISLSGILLYGVKDYRIDHNIFLDFPSTAIGVSGNYVHKWNRGVIDHNIFDNPYKDIFWNYTGNLPYWGYGVIVGGDYPNYPPMEYYLGNYNNNTAFIEDNSFARHRHSVAMSAEGGWAVVRNNNFTTMIVSYYGSYIDAHGGARGYEVYNNIINNSPTDYRSVGNQSGYYGKYMGIGVNPRGGSGVIYNNKFINFVEGATIVLSNDQSNPTYRLNGFWIWNNTFINVATQLDTSPGDFNITEGVEYFLYAKPNYTSYTYPHPLTLEGLKYYVNLTGIVRDSYTGLALQGVKVSCNNTFSSITNSSGEYFISIPIAAPFSCNISLSKEGYLSNSSIVSFSNNGSYIRNFYISQFKVSRITGRVVDKNNNPLQANVTVYQQGSSNVIANNSTINGYYYLVVSPGIYDVQFNFSSSNFVKLIAVNASEDVNNLIRTASYESNRVVLEIENNYTKRMEVYSQNTPSGIKLNRTSSPSWSYDYSRKIVSINLSVVIAKSGYWKDIQDAVDIVASMGGGSVYIPEGTWNFVNVNESWTGARVIIPAGVNLLGAPTERYPNGTVKEWKTVLVMPWDMPGDKGYVPPHWFLISGDGDLNKPSRFSDIKLVGYREFNHSATGFYLGIRVSGVINFRIDHCYLKEIPDGIQVGVGWDAQPASGVIDHCRLENDYGIPDPYDQRTTGYGIDIYRSENIYEWVNVQDIAGKYTNYTVFIEDCYFTKWRHVVTSNHGAHYVFRYNIINNSWAYGDVDQHPIYRSPYVPGRLAEVYNNIFLTPVIWDASRAIELSSGSAMIFNNTIPGGGWGESGKYWIIVQTQDLGWNPNFYPHDIYIWNNTITGSGWQLVSGDAKLNEDYFLYKPNWYIPYTYPHPLTKQ